MRVLIAIIMAFAFSVTANAGQIKFVKNMSWKQVLQLAKQQNKMIFFDAYASWCGPCKYLEESVYTDSDVAAYFNANFINVKQDMEIGEGIKLSQQFGIAAYPTLLFFSPAGKMVHKYVGAMEATAFIQLGKDAKNPATQYFTLKEKVKNNTISDADFVKWAATAKDVYDDDLGKYVKSFLARKKDILLNEHTAKVALKYADSLTDAEMFYLVNNQQKISMVMKTDMRSAWKMVYDKLFSMATKSYNESRDKEDFRKVFSKFLPANETLAMCELEIRIAIYIDDNTEDAAKLLGGFISDRSLNLQEAGELFYQHADVFTNTDMELLAKKLEQYIFTAKDQGKEGYLYFIQAVCYMGYDAKDKGKPYAQKAIDHAATPEDYKLMMRLLYGL